MHPTKQMLIITPIVVLFGCIILAFVSSVQDSEHGCHGKESFLAVIAHSSIQPFIDNYLQYSQCFWFIDTPDGEVRQCSLFGPSQDLLLV